jgi:hypothetical protein
MEAFKKTYRRGKRNNQTLLKRVSRDAKEWFDNQLYDSSLRFVPLMTWSDDGNTLTVTIMVE